MKATGEVMSICQNFEGALMKALRSLEQNIYSLNYGGFGELSDEELEKALHLIDDHRLFYIAEAFRRGYDMEKIHAINKIDMWFLDKIKVLVDMENRLKSEELTVELLKEAKRMEFPDKAIARLPERVRLKLRRCVTAIILSLHLKW